MISKSWVRYFPALLTLVVASIISAAGFHLSRSHFQMKAQAEFDREAEDRAHSIERAIRLRLLILESVHSMYVRARGEPRPEFRALVGPLQSQLRGVQAIEWIPRVRDEERDDFEEARRRDGFPGFQITERQAQGVMVRASRRDEYYPVFPLDPIDKRDPSIGFDLGSNPKRRQALEQARDTGRLTTSGRVTLLHEHEDGQFGFLVFAPVYESEIIPETVEARRELFRGSTIGVFRLHDIIEEALDVLGSEGVDLLVLDNAASEDERLLSTHYATSQQGSGRDSSVRGAFRPEDHVASFEVGQRTWSVHASATQRFMETRPDARSPLFFVAGLALGVPLCLYLLMTAKQSDALASLAADLEQRNEELEVLNHLILTGNRTRDLPSLLQSTVDTMLDQMGFDFGGIYLDDEIRHSAVLEYGRDLPTRLSERGESEVSTLSSEGMQVSVHEGSSFASFPIFSGDRTIGTLIVGRRSAEVPTEGQKKIFQSVGHQLGTLISRAKAEERTKSSLEEKEVLLKEIHHRVKNNLQTISSLHSLQMRKFGESGARDLFREMEQRVHSMALVHEQLYQSDNLARLDYAQYMRHLVQNLLRSYQGTDGRVSVEVEADGIQLPLDTAIPLGLILNELVSNALKHGFPEGRRGRVSVRLCSLEHDRSILTVRDDGVGLAPGVDYRNPSSLGLRLVLNLTRQLDGTFGFRRDNGTQFTVEFGN